MALRIAVIAILVGIIVVILVFSLPTTETENGNNLVTFNHSTTSLLLDLKIISLEEYNELALEHGILDDPVLASANQVGIVTLNKTILKPGHLEVGDVFTFHVFDNVEYEITVEKVEQNGTLMVSGHTQDASNNLFQLTETNGEFIASLDYIDNNLLYVIKKANPSAEAFLYKINMIAYEDIEDNPGAEPVDKPVEGN